MRHIKSINESINFKIYAVIIEKENDTDTTYFSDELSAADYLIRYINKYFGPLKKFEPMKEDDGTRLFLRVKDNPDYKRALNYVKNYKSEKIYIKEVTLSDSNYQKLL